MKLKLATLVLRATKMSIDALALARPASRASSNPHLVGQCSACYSPRVECGSSMRSTLSRSMPTYLHIVTKCVSLGNCLINSWTGQCTANYIGVVSRFQLGK